MKNERNRLFHGDVVRIDLKPNMITVTPGMKEFNGMVATISKVITKIEKKIDWKRVPNNMTTDEVDEKLEAGEIPLIENYWVSYELEGVVSPYGTPYTFMRDMLIDLE